MNPLTDTPTPQSHLSRSPLERVVCQVKFPPVFSIASQGFVGPFQERIRRHYPQASQAPMIRFQLNVPGVEAPLPGLSPLPGFRFEDEGQGWRVTLTQDSLALETKVYSNRPEFLERLGELVRALEETIHPTHRNRLGIRYINRIKEAADLQKLPALFRKEILGVASSLEMNGQVMQIYSEAIMKTPEGQLFARWGRLPANSTYDPFMVGPIEVNSWMLDLDASNESPQEFHADEIMASATALSERICAFFKWSITDTFLENFR